MYIKETFIKYIKEIFIYKHTCVSLFKFKKYFVTYSFKYYFYKI